MKIKKIIIKYSFQQREQPELPEEEDIEEVLEFEVKTSDPNVVGRIYLVKDDIIQILYWKEIQFDYHRMEYKDLEANKWRILTQSSKVYLKRHAKEPLELRLSNNTIDLLRLQYNQMKTDLDDLKI